MTYAAQEVGALGQPVELYHFVRRGVCWPYTSADRAIVFQGETYRPYTVSRGAFERNEESGSSEVTVHLDRTLKVCSQLLGASAPYPVHLTIYRLHRTDPQHIVLFTGVVANASLAGQQVTITCQSPLGSTEKSIPRHIIMRTCPHVLYGPRCALDPNDWDDTGEVSTITSNVVRITSLTAQSTGWYKAGVIQNLVTFQREFIHSHQRFSGYDDFTLLRSPPLWSVTDPVRVLAGCDRKHATCRDKFNNIPNFGGFPLHPERNPILDLTGDFTGGGFPGSASDDDDEDED